MSFKYNLNAKIRRTQSARASLLNTSSGGRNEPMREERTNEVQLPELSSSSPHENNIYSPTTTTTVSNDPYVPRRNPFTETSIDETFPNNEADDTITYPIIYLPKRTPSKRLSRKASSSTTKDNVGWVGLSQLDPINEGKDLNEGIDEVESSDNLKIKVELDFAYFFAILERVIWVTMGVGIVWALAIDFTKATTEVCKEGDKEKYPTNILPSLSRTMSSFRIGTILWTITVSLAFISRLASNYFLHTLYQKWYEPSCCNRVYLKISYILDNLEIVVLLLIPAFSLDCDPIAHRIVFILFLSLTFPAQLVQYSTRFLQRREGVELSKSVGSYYRHIGYLILLQLLTIGLMILGYLLHEYLCTDFLYSIFTLGEYATVVINVRFKRDTVIFVK